MPRGVHKAGDHFTHGLQHSNAQFAGTVVTLQNLESFREISILLHTLIIIDRSQTGVGQLKKVQEVQPTISQVTATMAVIAPDSTGGTAS